MKSDDLAQKDVPSDDELAAAIAAVTAYMASADAPGESESAPALPAWRAASLLEGAAGSPRRTSPIDRGNNALWRSLNTARRFLVWATLISSATICSCDTAAGAEELMPPVAPNRAVRTGNVAPPPAPSAVLAPPVSNIAIPELRGFLPETNAEQGSTSAPSAMGGSAIESSADPVVDDHPQGPMLPEPDRAAGPVFIRVALALGSELVNVAIPDGASVRDASNGSLLAVIPPHSRWQIATNAPGGYGQISFSGRAVNAARMKMALAAKPSAYRNVAFVPNMPNLSQPDMDEIVAANPKFWLPAVTANKEPRSYIIEPSGKDGVFGVNGKLYRGALLLRPAIKSGAFSLNAINSVDIEDYLLSVVPAEMPYSWPAEALKAQSIAARSYAVANLGKHSAEGYDVKANTEDQVYVGISNENDNTNRAVAETQGLVLKHEGKPISAFFHSASGGHTELCENVWSKALPYLRAVPDYDDSSPNFSWTRTLTTSRIEQAVRKAGREVGAVLAMLPVARGQSPRVKTIMVVGSKAVTLISGEQFRGMFALPSTFFNVGSVENAYVIAGRGSGHGLGLSQWGAKRLAQEGYNAAQILSYYYKDVTIDGQ